jgi:signal transduction histidine kinase
VAPHTLSLRTRLVLTVSVIVAIVLGIESMLEIRLFEKAAERDLRETGLVTAEAVVDDLELRRGPWVPEEIEEGLREFARGVPSIRAISLVTLRDGAPTVLASTASSESSQAIALARETILAGEQGWRDDGPLTRLALRTSPGAGGNAAVVVTLSLAAASQLRTSGRLVSVWLVPVAIVVLTLVLDQALRRLVHRPIAAIRQTMARAGAGELAARVEVARSDEMGEVATGLNQMLERLADFNLALEERIRTITSALDRSHAERIDSYQRLLAMRDALGESERLAAVGQTAASVAHQVGTPLNLISGHVQLLLAQPDLPAETTRRLKVIQDQIAKVTEAVRGLVEHVRRPAPDAQIDVGDLLRSIGVLIRPRLNAAGVQMGGEVADELPPVRGDRSELEMALLNLVSNAVDAMPSGGDLRIGASAVDDGIRIVMEDSGSGVPPDLLPRIFEPWVTTKPPGRGTGLGLSITRDVIARMGGTIAAAPASPHGTIITVTLPADGGDVRQDADAAHR